MMDFSASLRAIMAIDPGATAIVQDDRDHSWDALATCTADIVATLDAAGIDRGHRIGVLIRNRASQAAAMLALLTSERCLVVLNPVIAPEKLALDIAGLGLAAIIGEEADIDRREVRDAASMAGCATITVATGLGAVEQRQEVGARVLDDHDLSRSQTAVEMLTSGTTGAPKRIPLSRRAFGAALEGALVYEKGRESDSAPRLRSGVSLQVGPMAHIGGMFGMLNTLLAGRTLVLFDRFDVQAWRAAVVRYRPKVASLVPAALRMVLDADVPRADLESLVALRSGTAPLPPETVREFLDRYDLPVLQNYGATEFIGGLSGWTLPDFRRYFHEKPRSCGRIHDDVQARVIDLDSGEVLPPGSEGVLEVKAPQINGGADWYRTTDRAIIDADNFLTICGRTDQAIIRGGFKVHPDEVVAAMLKHPSVREVVVVGLPDARLGSVPAAAVILREGMTASSEELIAFLRDHLSPYQLPAHILFVTDFPRTPALKPVLPAVTALLAESVAA